MPGSNPEELLLDGGDLDENLLDFASDLIDKNEQKEIDALDKLERNISAVSFGDMLLNDDLREFRDSDVAFLTKRDSIRWLLRNSIVRPQPSG